MTTSSGCPSEEDLAGFAAGNCPDDRAVGIRSHLDACSRCAQWVAEAQSNEALLTGVRQALVNQVDAGSTVALTWRDRSSGSATEKVIPRRLGSIRLMEELGRGGMGIVYSGRDEMLRRVVAVKFLLGAVPDEDDPHFERFLTGAQAEAAVRGPNIVPVFAAGLADGAPYLVMEFIDGPTLQAVLRSVGAIPLAASMKVIWDMASAAESLHARGYVHRDLKPANVIFDREGRLMLTDFGLASLRRRSDGPTFVAGTPAYMAPEALEGRVTPRTDVYALGVILYELLTGVPPFRGDLESLRSQHAKMPLPVERLGDHVPGPVVEIIERAAHKRDMFRYKTAKHFQEALRDAVATPDVLAQGEVELRAALDAAVPRDPNSRPSAPLDATPSSSYFERLSELAIQKASDSKGACADEVRTPKPIRSEGSERRLVHDVPCAGCGYNVRSLPIEGCCSECQEPVESSLDPERLVFADRRVLARLLLAQTTSSWALVGALLGFPLRSSLTGWTAWAAAVGLAAGVFLYPMHESARPKGRSRFLMPWVARVSIVAAVGASLVWLLLPREILVYPEESPTPLGAVLSFLNQGYFVAGACLLLYLGGLAEKIPDRRLARGARICVTVFCCAVFLRLPSSLFLRSTPVGAGLHACGILLLLLAVVAAPFLMFLYRRAFRRLVANAVPLADVLAACAAYGQGHPAPSPDADAGRRSPGDLKGCVQ